MGGIEAFVLCVRYLGGAHQEGTADRNRVDGCFVKVLSYSVASHVERTFGYVYQFHAQRILLLGVSSGCQQGAKAIT